MRQLLIKVIIASLSKLDIGYDNEHVIKSNDDNLSCTNKFVSNLFISYSEYYSYCG